MKLFEEEIKLAIKAALLAAEKIMQIYQSINLNIRQKNDFTPVTDADLLADEIINEILGKTGIPVISEENVSDTVILSNQSRYWLVDPLDGTKEFIQKNGEFCINIALVENSVPIAGIIAIPANFEIYVAAAEKGRVFKADFHNQSYDNLQFKELKKPDINPVNKQKIMLMSRSHRREKDSDPVIDTLLKRFSLQYLYVGSAIKYVYLIQGKGHIYYRDGNTMEWDTAAGDAILRAFDGAIFDLNTREKLRYGKHGFLNSAFIASLMPIDQVL